MTPRRILVLGWLVFVLYAYPGYTTPASLDMMIEARYLEFSDQHSPMISIVWRIVGTFVHGPLGMLLLQSACVLFGAYVLLGRRLPQRTAAIASASLLVFPPVMAAMAVVEQDAMLAGFLVAGTALITAERRPLRIAGLVTMMFACGMRDGAWLAAFPLVVFGFVWDAKHGRVVRYAIAFAAWLASALLAYGITNALPDYVTRRHETSLAMFDIVGVLAKTDRLTDVQVRDLTKGVKFATLFGLQERAKEARGKQLVGGPLPVFVEPVTDADVEALLAARSRLRAHDPGTYAAMRWRQWQRVLSPHKRHLAYADDGVSGDQRIVVAHAARHSAVQKGLVWVMRLFERTPLFLPFLYLGIALVMLPFARRQREAFLFLASAIVFELALGVLTWDFDFRYSTWLLVATVIAGVSTVYSRVSASRSPPQPV